jgi:hypothetical protein
VHRRQQRVPRTLAAALTKAGRGLRRPSARMRCPVTEEDVGEYVLHVVDHPLARVQRLARLL